jgi:hypothetical protein
VTKAFEGIMLTSAVCYNPIFGSFFDLGIKSLWDGVDFGTSAGTGKMGGAACEISLLF